MKNEESYIEYRELVEEISVAYMIRFLMAGLKQLPHPPYQKG